MNAIIDITGLTDAEIDRLLGVDPFVVFADAAAEAFLAQWLPLKAAAWGAMADIAFELEQEGERVDLSWVHAEADGLLVEAVHMELGLQPNGNPTGLTKGWK